MTGCLAARRGTQYGRHPDRLDTKGPLVTWRAMAGAGGARGARRGIAHRRLAARQVPPALLPAPVRESMLAHTDMETLVCGGRQLVLMPGATLNIPMYPPAGRYTQTGHRLHATKLQRTMHWVAKLCGRPFAHAVKPAPKAAAAVQAGTARRMAGAFRQVGRQVGVTAGARRSTGISCPVERSRPGCVVHTFSTLGKPWPFTSRRR